MTTQEKGRGLRFAEQQLLRHGWEQGKGLGKGENGISEAIKVKVKCDKRGVGHKEGEQFTFHWWDHVFNKASSNLAVESGQDGVGLKKVEGEEEEGMISNKKPRKASLNKPNLYGCFVKSATLFSGQEHPEHRSFSSDDSSSSDDEKLDLSSTTKLSDKALMKACGGRTAHKGARHGFTMSAKLARLEQQEQEFMAKYGEKIQTAKTTSQNEDSPCSTESSCMVAKTKHKKSKKKKQDSDELLDNCAQEGDANREVAQIHLNDATSKKQKKRSKEKHSEIPDALVDSDETVNSEKIVMVPSEEVNGSILLDEDPIKSFQQCEETAHPLTGDRVSKKGKKKKKHSKQRSALEEELSENSVVASVDTKMSHGQEQPECNSVPTKKKKKSSKSNREESSATELETPSILKSITIGMSTTVESMETAAGEREKSKSKKRKQCREEDQNEVLGNGILDEHTEQKKKKKKKLLLKGL
ncbi:hypothetical protein MHYP_G00022850 [Metynnis hypsauchen]